MRILVTGSRDWPDEHYVNRELLKQLNSMTTAEDLVIIHGACPTGADEIASQFARFYENSGVREEKHPADWSKYGRAAGPRRNDEMIATKPDLALVFFYNRSAGKSRGTQYTYNKILENNIPHIVWELDDTHL